MTLDLCERSKRGVGAPTRRSGSPATIAPPAAAAVAAAPTLAALLVSGSDQGVRGRIEDPSHQDRAGRGHMSLNPISSQSLTVFIYLFIRCAQAHPPDRAVRTATGTHPSSAAPPLDRVSPVVAAALAPLALPSPTRPAMMHTALQPAISLWPNAARDARAAGCDGSADLRRIASTPPGREPPSSPNAVGSLLASSNIVMPDFSCCARIA